MAVSWLFGGKFGNLLHADMRPILRAERADVFAGNAMLNNSTLVRSSAVKLARNVDFAFATDSDSFSRVS